MTVPIAHHPMVGGGGGHAAGPRPVGTIQEGPDMTENTTNDATPTVVQNIENVDAGTTVIGIDAEGDLPAVTVVQHVSRVDAGSTVIGVQRRRR